MKKWIRQPLDKKICGQIAVAVIAECSVEEAIVAIRKISYTKTVDLARGLRRLGYSCPDKLKVMKHPPKLGIGKLSYPRKRNWHWVVFDGRKIFDGINGNENGTVNWQEGWKVTSYLPIKKDKEK